jgi:hypothetical protein
VSMKRYFLLGLGFGAPVTAAFLVLSADEMEWRVAVPAVLLLASGAALAGMERHVAVEGPLRFGAFAVAAISGATMLGALGAPLWLRVVGILAASGVMEWWDRRRR